MSGTEWMKARREDSTADIDARFAAAVKHAKSYQMQTLFAIQEKEPLDLSEGLRLFELLDFTKTNTLTKQEIIDGCTHEIKKHERVIEFLEKHENTPFGLLKSKKSIDKVFKRVDKDKDGKLQLSEWKLFLAELIERDLDYLIEKGWASNNCYWAKAPPSDSDPSCWYLTNSEWLADFWYYEKNNNHLLGIFMTDENSPLQTLERLNIEFCCESWALLFTVLLAGTRSSDTSSELILIFIFITLPTLLIRNFLLLCFKCSCLVRRHHMSCWRRCCIPILEAAGHLVGLITFLGAILALVLGIMIAVDLRASDIFWLDYIVSLIMGFLYGFFFDLFVPFNPLVCVGNLVENHSCICCACKILRLGRWQQQRKVALAFYKANNYAPGLELTEIETSVV